jgi:hypothetical protein
MHMKEKSKKRNIKMSYEHTADVKLVIGDRKLQCRVEISTMATASDWAGWFCQLSLESLVRLLLRDKQECISTLNKSGFPDR